MSSVWLKTFTVKCDWLGTQIKINYTENKTFGLSIPPEETYGHLLLLFRKVFCHLNEV